MSDVKNKSKKMDVRLPEQVYEELALVAWWSEQKRSELLRMMITDFMQRGTLEMDGQNMTWDECVCYARFKMFQEDVSLDDLQRSRANHPTVAFPEEMKEDIDEATEILIRAVRKNVKKGLRM